MKHYSVDLTLFFHSAFKSENQHAYVGLFKSKYASQLIKRKVKNVICNTIILVITTTILQAQTIRPSMQQTSTFKPVNTTSNNQHQKFNSSKSQTNNYNQSNQIEEISTIKKEMESASKSNIHFSFPSNTKKKGAEFYAKAYDLLNGMLVNENTLNVKKAVFAVENAYSENTLAYSNFEKRILNITSFCKLKMKEEKTNRADNQALNEILFRLLSDTLYVIDPTSKKKIIHYPVQYNFNDFYGQQDWSNMFVSKLISTNYGQCHSMPLLYKILAHEIGAKCYISTSPNHLYIKYKQGNQWKNVELTNGHYTSDAFIIGSGYIKSEAIKSKTYMDTLSDKNTIALMMQDLAKGYYVKYGMDDFVLKCCNTALKYYPNDSYGMCIKSDYFTMLFQYIVSQTNARTLEDVLKIPQAKEVYTNMKNMYVAIDKAGVSQIPEEAYEQWLGSLDEAKRKQQYEMYQKIYKDKLAPKSLNDAHEKK